MNSDFKNFDLRIFEERTEPSYTYYLDPDTLEIGGYKEGIEAFAQSIFLYLSTRRYQWDVFPDDDFGMDYSKFIGRNMDWAIPNLEREIKDAISIDTRCKGFGDFEWEIWGPRLICTFTVLSDLGEVEGSLDFNVESGEFEVETNGV